MLRADKISDFCRSVDPTTALCRRALPSALFGNFGIAVHLGMSVDPLMVCGQSLTASVKRSRTSPLQVEVHTFTLGTRVLRAVLSSCGPNACVHVKTEATD